MKDGLCNKPRLVYKVRTLETGSLRYFVDFSWGADRHSHPPAAVIPLTSSLPTQYWRRQRSPKKMSIWDFADLIAAGALTHGLEQLNVTSPLSHLTWGIFARWKRCDAPRPPACTVCTVRLECENCKWNWRLVVRSWVSVTRRHPLIRQLGGAHCATAQRVRDGWGRQRARLMGRGRRWAGCADLCSLLRGVLDKRWWLRGLVSRFGRSAGLCQSWCRVIILLGLLC